MANILLVGAFGQRNVGDEALCEVICASLADHHVTIASARPGESTAQHGRPSILATGRNVAAAIRKCDAVVVGGGTVFKTLHPSSNRRPSGLLVNTLGLLTLAHLHHVPVAFVGVGAGELRGDLPRALAKRIVPRADLLVLRDEESASVLTDAGIPPPFWIGADPAWRLFAESMPNPISNPISNTSNGSYPATSTWRGAARPPRVTVALSHLADAGSGGSDHVEHLGRGLAGLAESGWVVNLQPWQHGDSDLDVADALRRHVPRAVVTRVPADLRGAAAEYADTDLVVAMRFHAIVAAGAAGCRTLAIAHEPKLAGLARRLDQVAVPTHASTAVVASALDWAIEHAPPSRAAVQRQIDLADHTIRMMRLVVDGGQLERPDELPALQLSDGEGRW
jgi:polysaccharide pyruvyl transferase WcaK-like protein